MTRARLTERLARARRTLALALAGRALLLAVATLAGTLAVLTMLDALVALPLGVRRAALPLASLAAAAVLAVEVARRARPAFTATAEQVALWFEARLPALRYALVTAAAGDALEDERLRPLLAQVAPAPLELEARAAGREALLRPALAAAAALALLLVLPRGAAARLAAPTPGDALARAGSAARAAGDPLATLVVRVTPPAYTGLRAQAFDDPSAVPALVGSQVTIEGLGPAGGTAGAADGVRALVGGRELPAASSGDRWRVALAVPAEPLGVQLRAGARERVLVIEPVADSIPTVRLERPGRDSVLRAATGEVTLSAEVRDDHGLADAAFEYIVSSGAGETFTFRGGRIAARTFGAGTARARLEGTVRLDTLRLGPGDLVHLRAVARDRNDVTGPGVGASETRTLRIARPEEYDSVAVDPMPPSEPEKNALSQRMILELTQDLDRRSRRLGPAATTREARRIAVDQTKLRKRVGEIVFTRLSEDQGEHAHFAGDGHEHGQERPLDPDQVLAAAERAANADPTRTLEGEGDETPVVAINRPLLEAYNHMWSASSALETGDPHAAIPWMQRAIEALQRARAAERIYLRGRPPRVVVDLAKVRGTGKEKGSSNARLAREALDPARAARLARFDALLGGVAADPASAADRLLLLRLDLPATERAAAEALTAAADAVRRGGDVTGPLQRARRALVGAPERADALGPWGM